jgi:hypothetical protein
VPIAADQLPDDPQVLKRIIAAMAQDAVAAQAEIARLKFQLARYRRAEFGRSSEKLAHETELQGNCRGPGAYRAAPPYKVRGRDKARHKSRCPMGANLKWE